MYNAVLKTIEQTYALAAPVGRLDWPLRAAAFDPLQTLAERRLRQDLRVLPSPSFDVGARSQLAA